MFYSRFASSPQSGPAQQPTKTSMQFWRRIVWSWQPKRAAVGYLRYEVAKKKREIKEVNPTVLLYFMGCFSCFRWIYRLFCIFPCSCSTYIQLFDFFCSGFFGELCVCASEKKEAALCSTPGWTELAYFPIQGVLESKHQEKPYAIVKRLIWCVHPARRSHEHTSSNSHGGYLWTWNCPVDWMCLFIYILECTRLPSSSSLSSSS